MDISGIDRRVLFYSIWYFNTKSHGELNMRAISQYQSRKYVESISDVKVGILISGDIISTYDYDKRYGKNTFRFLLDEIKQIPPPTEEEEEDFNLYREKIKTQLKKFKNARIDRLAHHRYVAYKPKKIQT